MKLRRLWPIIRKEFLHLIRDPLSLTIMIILPVLLLTLYGFGASFDVKDIPMVVYDQSRSAASRQFLDKFTNSGYFHRLDDLTSVSQFADYLGSGRAKVVVNIPADFAAAPILRAIPRPPQ